MAVDSFVLLLSCSIFTGVLGSIPWSSSVMLYNSK